MTQGARHESYEVEVGKWLDQNIGIKKRIQSMRWYREFILQQISQNEFQKHLEHVLWIEEMLTKNPGTLEKVQYEGWWQKYLYGEILPERILRAYLKPSIQLEIFSREYPDIYHQTSQMSVWES